MLPMMLDGMGEKVRWEKDYKWCLKITYYHIYVYRDVIKLFPGLIAPKCPSHGESIPAKTPPHF